MIFFGHKAKSLGTQSLQDKCARCGEAKLQWVGVQKYAHIYWIPSFPLGKKLFIVCEGCQALTPESALDEKFKPEAKAFRATLKTPFWTFTGLGIIALIIGAVTINDRHRMEKVHTMQAHPQVGDVWVFRIREATQKDFPYTFAKIVEISDQTLLMRFSKHSYQKSTQIEKRYTEDPENLGAEIQGVPLTGIDQKLEVTEIFRESTT